MKILMIMVVVIVIVDIFYLSLVRLMVYLKEQKFEKELGDVNQNFFPHEIELCVKCGAIPSPSRRELLITYSLLHEYEHERYGLFLDKFGYK